MILPLNDTMNVIFLKTYNFMRSHPLQAFIARTVFIQQAETS